eukprot:scaffold9772_cov128-Isochrysis_galbana.AAC.3
MARRSASSCSCSCGPSPDGPCSPEDSITRCCTALDISLSVRTPSWSHGWSKSAVSCATASPSATQRRWMHFKCSRRAADAIATPAIAGDKSALADERSAPTAHCATGVTAAPGVSSRSAAPRSIFSSARTATEAAAPPGAIICGRSALASARALPLCSCDSKRSASASELQCAIAAASRVPSSRAPPPDLASCSSAASASGCASSDLSLASADRRVSAAASSVAASAASSSARVSAAEDILMRAEWRGRRTGLWPRCLACRCSWRETPPAQCIRLERGVRCGGLARLGPPLAL